MIKLPDEWVSWTRKAGLEPEPPSWEGEPPLYFRGHGRHWRVNCLGYFQFSEKYETFDRWANSLGWEIPTPNTYEELFNFVERSKSFEI